MDTVQCDNKDEIDKLIYDFEREFIAPEEIGFIDNPDNMTALTLETNVNVVDQRTTHTKELETNKKKKKPEENTRSHGNTTFLYIL